MIYNEERFVETIGPVIITVYKHIRKTELELCLTTPYAPDGVSPLIFLDLGLFLFIIESRAIYGWLYKKRYGWEIDWDYIDRYEECR